MTELAWVICVGTPLVLTVLALLGLCRAADHPRPRPRTEDEQWADLLAAVEMARADVERDWRLWETEVAGW